VGGDAAVPSRDMVVVGADPSPIAVTEQGQGPAILLLHAGSTNQSSWDGVAAALSPGAVVALQGALAAPVRFAGLVLYEPPLAVTEPLGGEALRRARVALDAGDPGRAVTIHLREIVGSSRFAVAVMRLLPPIWQVLRGYAPAQILDDEAIEALGVGLERYARLDLPALLLGGGRSPAHLRARLDALAAVLPRLDAVVILPRQGHLATLRAPTEVAQVIASFADRVLR
jgi:pimeloyl-ACP methyl ester carboxylesterase